ncbi:MAG: hypothetical protein JW956_03900 [Calditrichaceae bacterium]|nr:hypothetical protein [Calditrichaceae bacterium]
MFDKWLIILLITGLFFYSESIASFEHKDQGSENVASGSCGIASCNNAFAIFINPAKIGLSGNPAVNLFYRNYYGLKDINQMSLASHFSIFKMPLGLGISTFGNKLYRETELRAGVGVELIQQIRLGVSLNLYHLDIKNYGSAIGWGFDLAALKAINDEITMAFVVSNLNEPKIGAVKERIPAYFGFGLAYRPLSIIELNLDIIKDDQFDFDYRFGVQYNVNQWFSVICGFRDLVNSVSAGLKITNNNYNLNYGFQYHPQLGGSNSMSIGYAF